MLQYVTPETLTVRAYSCRLHHINFFECLSDILNRMSEMPNGTPVEAFRNLLPNKWTKKEQSKLQLSVRKRFNMDKSLNSNNLYYTEKG